MESDVLRGKFLDFFVEKGHRIIPSASLVPENDPSVLFTTAGMHPLVPFLLGEIHPGGQRLTNFQKSLRTDDIDEVGDETHLTFFEMLGNWSLGDSASPDGIGPDGYWKKEAIEWSYEFLTNKEWLGLDKHRLGVTVFAGDKDAPRDEESAAIWKSLVIHKSRIAYLGKKDNWWGPPEVTGPCGPDTEMFYWTGKEKAPDDFDPENKLWVEVWNDVFMQYNKTITGKFEPLRQRNVDTGMGLERMTAVLENKPNVFETELFLPLIEKIRSLTNRQNIKAERIIADHLRAATFLIADGVVPSNKDRGYVLRRLIRRAVTFGKQIGIEQEFSTEIGAIVIKNYHETYPGLRHHENKIVEELNKEEMRFRERLGEGLKILGNLNASGKDITGAVAFDLYQTHGFPLEQIEELVKLKNPEEFEQEFKKHQALSRTASSGQFKGGLAEQSEKVVRLHTATHLLNQALREVLGEYVFQKGSNITGERSRFDFSHDKKLTKEEKQKIEDKVNDWIKQNLAVKKEIMPQDEARKMGAIGVFDEKYGDRVSVYTVFDPKTEKIISREFCGGPHVENTGKIGKFKILKEEAVAAGIRRIRAVVEE